MTELLFISAGALLGYLLSRLQQWQDRKRKRQIVATALLEELRTLENTLRKKVDDEKAGLMGGRLPQTLYPNLGDAIELFQNDTCALLMRFTSSLNRVDALWAACNETPVAQITEHHHWKLRGAAAFAARMVPAVKDALVDAGGHVLDQKPVERVSFPNLPPLGEPAFHWTVTRLDSDESKRRDQ